MYYCSKMSNIGLNCVKCAIKILSLCFDGNMPNTMNPASQRQVFCIESKEESQDVYQMEWVWIYFFMCKYTGDFCNKKCIGSGLVLMMPRFRSCHYIRCISATPSVEMLPLHLSQSFTGISGFSCIILPSPADTLSKAMQQKSHSVFFQYLLLTLTASFGSADGKQLLFISRARIIAFILRWSLSMCFIYYLFFIC